MFQTEIKGITVKFPYKPYDVQIKYMESVIECLNVYKNAILASPSGIFGIIYNLILNLN